MINKYSKAMEITEQAEADVYFEELLQQTMVFGRTREEAEEIERHNLGYYAGCYDNETRERVERLFKCKHPVFGAIAENGPYSIEQAFTAGVEPAKHRATLGA